MLTYVKSVLILYAPYCRNFSLVIFIITSLAIVSSDQLSSQCLTREVSSVAGTGISGFLDGPGITAKFNSPFGIVIDNSGNLFVADSGNHRIRKITPTGDVSTIAGTGVPGFMDGPSITAQFNSPKGIVIDTSGNLYIADSGNSRVRKITPAGIVSTIAGTGEYGFKDGPGIAAQFSSPFGIEIDDIGNLYIADNGNHRIRKLATDGNVTTVVGTGVSGFLEGPISIAQLAGPTDVHLNAAGELFIVDQNNHRIRKLSKAGVVSTIAGSGLKGSLDGEGVTAQFTLPYRIDSDEAGNCYVTDISGSLRKVTPSGLVSTLANSISSGFRLGPVEIAEVHIRDLTVDNISGDFFTVGADRVLKISDCPIVQPVPTMGEWGLINLGLLLIIVGIVTIKSRDRGLINHKLVRTHL